MVGCIIGRPIRPVALLAEGVDRNIVAQKSFLSQVMVALLAEGVDRNAVAHALGCGSSMSPSSRRAWIEMVGEW